LEGLAPARPVRAIRRSPRLCAATTGFCYPPDETPVSPVSTCDRDGRLTRIGKAMIEGAPPFGPWKYPREEDALMREPRPGCLPEGSRLSLSVDRSRGSTAGAAIGPSPILRPLITSCVKPHKRCAEALGFAT
jgi:hypothetical protein